VGGGLEEAVDTLPLEVSFPHFLVHPSNVIMASLSSNILLTLSCSHSPLACYCRALAYWVTVRESAGFALLYVISVFVLITYSKVAMK
jgi:hypothetical protein